MIRIIDDKDKKKAIAREVLETLTEWFEVEKSREDYIEKSQNWPFFVAYEDESSDKPIGFLCLKSTGADTVELAVMGVLKECHRKGVGKELFAEAKQYAIAHGYSFMQVKTVKSGVYDDYDKTNAFYRRLGFKEFEVIETYWDEANPCQIYVMSLRSDKETGRTVFH